MKKILSSIEEAVGATPLLELSRFRRASGFSARLFAKLESFNPAGSVKDRAAKQMIDDAEKAGLLSPGAAVIEPTSGNTGIGLAMIAAVRGYRLILTMPETMSEERRRILRAYGAEIVLTDGKKGMAGAIEKAKELSLSIPGSFIPSQFDNPSNPAAHFLSTGPEIREALDGKVDAFIAGVGSGGTITGVGEYLKKKDPSVHIAAVEPDTSAVLSGKAPGPHKIQGIGAGFVPKALNTKIFDEVIPVSAEHAFETARLLARTEGVLAGISSGAALWAALALAKRERFAGKNLVVLLPDGGDRYYSTPLFQY